MSAEFEIIGNTVVNYGINALSQRSIGFDLQNGTRRVTKITVWTGRYDYDGGHSTVLYGIRVTWDDGKTSDIAGSDQNASETFTIDLRTNENITSMTIRSHDRVDGMRIVTNNQDWNKGGSTGDPHGQQTGNGVLLGFNGTYKGGQLWSLGAIFHNSNEVIPEL